MKKLAIIHIIDNKKEIRGGFLASHNRAKYLLALKKYEIDLFLIKPYRLNIVTRLIGKEKKEINTHFSFDGLTYKIILLNSTIIDYLLRRIGKPQFIKNQQLKKIAKSFSKYDLLSVHSIESGYIALISNRLFGIPYTVTWHGSDIHTNPFLSKVVYHTTQSVLESASMNFFVSETLFKDSKKIAKKASGIVLYNGVDKNQFYPFPDNQRLTAQKKYGINHFAHNVLFIGDFQTNKNIQCLAEVLAIIMKKIPDVELYVAGYTMEEKHLVPKIAASFKKYNITAHFLGQILSTEMPSVINCMNLCILPSYNEGLPLISVESLACNVPFVGSRVGGIAEVVGEENTIPHNTNFIPDLASLCIKILLNPTHVELKSQFDWKTSSKTESQIYAKILGNTNS